jgi:hypothetical protein
MTVYVLGAGASKHVGYPLASTMGTEMLAWMSRRDEYRHAADFIRETFGDSPNIEDVITDLDALVKSLEGSAKFDDRLLRNNAAQQRGKLREALPLWFSEIHFNPAPAYQTFAENIIQPGDVIITFNYDDSLERELRRASKWDISNGYGFHVGQATTPSQVLVLKLHGSMNWLVSIFNGITSGGFSFGANGSLGRYPHIATDFLKYLGYENMTGTFPGGGGFPSLILPGKTKEFYYETSFGPEHEEFFASLWSQAAAALGQTNKVVLCGYSLLPVDQKACELLLGEAHREADVLVISGGDGLRIAKRFNEAGFRNVKYCQRGYFEEWVRTPNEDELAVSALQSTCP